MLIITTRVRTYDGRLCFHKCVSVQLSGGYPISGLGRGGAPFQVWVGGYPISGLGRVGTPSQVQVWGGTPSQVQMGGTPSQVQGVLQVPLPGIASTCYGYMVGGMPLAFMQEDCLVLSVTAFVLNANQRQN